ncbi:MAG: helix-turn-helix transcriptional regulator [Firmicutes bacterium]|nr:helix-turn-helix transcriptional regulator [Bacillota bacterium]
MDNSILAVNTPCAPENTPGQDSFRCSLLFRGNETLLLCDASPLFFTQFHAEPECRGKNVFRLLQKELPFLTELLSERLLPERRLRYFAELKEQNGTSFWELTLENMPPFLQLAARRCSPEKVAARYCSGNSVDLASFYVPGYRSILAGRDANRGFRLFSGNSTAERYYRFPSEVTEKTFARLSFLRSARLFACAERQKGLCFYEMVPDETGTGHGFLRILCLPVEQERQNGWLLLAAPCAAEEFFEHCAGSRLKKSGFDQCPYAVATFLFSGGSPVLEGFNRSCEKLLRKGFPVAELLQSDAVRKGFQSGMPGTGQAQLNSGVYDVSVLPVQDEDGTKRMTVTIVPVQAAPQTVPAAPGGRLTPREKETLSLAAQGYPNRYIAHRMEISEGTVKKLLYNGYQKLGVSSRVELCRMLLPQGAAMG